MTDEPIMTEKESMELITSMINRAKNNFSERGLLYLIWGWVILFCCVVNFTGEYFFHIDNIYFIWLLADVVAIGQVFYLRRKWKSERLKTYTGEINGYVWMVFLISLVLMVFICNVMKLPAVINPLLLVFYGMPTFLSGIILKFRPLITGAVICWVLAIISPFIGTQFSILLIALAIIIAWLIPGYLLKQRFKKANVVP